ncbi:MAG: peptidoglycan DD-metalloendopeptidase family protein [Nitratireductor sp.]|nr:peptidoglycan DD-metalloendopeptidase family protein [Nitratireductor sp.]
MFAVGYFSATAYLVLRDDLIGMTQARSARMLHEYEDRIAALRANLDRVTSRQLLDQQAIEAKVAELMKRQEALGGRSSPIGKLLEEAQKRGLATAAIASTTEVPQTTGSVAKPAGASPLEGLGLRGAKGAIQADAAAPILPGRQAAAHDINDYAQTQDLFRSVKERIETVDRAQRDVLDSLRREATQRTAAIVDVLTKLKIRTGKENETGIGGPYVPLDPATEFDAHVEALDNSLKALGEAQGTLARVPVANPAPGSPLSSPFGARSDPFFGHQAMHTGLDFRASTGTPVYATAGGKVIDAGRNGGYGKMVEIDHGNGIVTRYAHLSRISVESGQKIARGAKVGEVGSTGRSTGPHLHYEVRRHGQAVDPAVFLKAGRKIPELL